MTHQANRLLSTSLERLSPAVAMFGLRKTARGDDVPYFFTYKLILAISQDLKS